MKIKKGVVLLLAFVLSCSCKFDVSAQNNIVDNCSVTVETDAPNLIDNYDADSILCDKLEYDKERDTTELNTEIEENLNEAGVFDEEINDLDQDTIETLNNSINTTVYISYINPEENTCNSSEMDSDEIDEIVQEQIDDNKIEYEEDSSVINTIGKAIGIIPEEVYASDSPLYDADDTHVSVSGAMKQTVYACQYKKKGIIYVTATATWLKEAFYRGKDIFYVCLDRADIEKNSFSCTHKATYYLDIDSESFHRKKYLSNDVDNWVRSEYGNGIAYTVDLFGTRKSMALLSAQGSEQRYENERIIIKFKCEYTSKKSVFTTHYKHWKSNLSVSPQISWGDGVFSVGLSGSVSDHYEEITHNASLPYYHI